MAFIDRVVEHPGRYILTNADSGVVLGTFDLVRSEGEEYTPGTLLNALNLNTQTQLDSNVETIFTNAGMSAGTYQNEVSDALGFIINGAIIAEHGTVQGGTGNNKWTYRKWSNGMIEAWGKASTSSAQAGSSWASPIYYYDLSVSFPSGIFSSAPDNIQLTNANAQWVTLGTNAITASGFNTRLIKPTSGAQAVVFNIYAVKYPTS